MEKCTHVSDMTDPAEKSAYKVVRGLAKPTTHRLHELFMKLTIFICTMAIAMVQLVITMVSDPVWIGELSLGRVHQLAKRTLFRTNRHMSTFLL